MNASLVPPPPSATDGGGESRESEGFRTEEGSEMAEDGLTHADWTSSGFNLYLAPLGAAADERPLPFDELIAFGSWA